MTRPNTKPGRVLSGVRWWVAAVMGVAAIAWPHQAGAAGEGKAATESVGGLVCSPEKDWPQWRGPRRDGICNEKGLLQAWPEKGPKLLWTAQGLGRGWSCPILAGKRLYITGDVGEDLVIFALDRTQGGKVVWRVTNGTRWRRSYPGARACCLISEGKLYHMNAHGRVVCLDAATGKAQWARETVKDFGAKEIRWGHSECLLADGDRVIATPGGRKAHMVALNKHTGKTVWASDPICDDDACYASPILFAYGGMRHLVSFTSRRAFGVNADTGKVLWTHERHTKYQVIAAQAVYRDGTLLAASPDGTPTELLNLTVTGDAASVKPLWSCNMMNLSGGVIYLGGSYYGSGYRRSEGWWRVDAATGKELWHDTSLNTGAILRADGRFYLLSERGEAALVSPGKKGWTYHGRFRLVPSRHRDVWTHPVVHDGKLYLRYHDTLWCYDVAAR